MTRILVIGGSRGIGLAVCQIAVANGHFVRAMSRGGRLPEKVTADSGYFSPAAVTNEALSSVDLYVTPDSGKKTEQVEESTTELPPPTEFRKETAE